MDDFNRYTCIFLILTKANSIVILKHFLTQVHNIYSTIVKTLRIDNGSKFFSHAFQTLLCDLGIAHQSTCVHTPQQNGIIEKKKHRIIFYMAKYIRFQAFIPLKF